MINDDHSQKELMAELAAMRQRIAELEKKEIHFQKMENELVNKNQECQLLTVELEGKYRTIQMHESMLNQDIVELKEKNLQLSQYARQLRRKKLTIRVMAALIAMTLITLVLAASLGKIGALLHSIQSYNDSSYRPMDLERGGKSHPVEIKKE